MANAEFIRPLVLPALTVSALGTGAGYSVDYVGNDYAGVVYKSGGGVAGGYIQMDFGADVTIDRVMMFGLLDAPTDATVQISCSTTAQGATYAGWTGAAVALYAGTNRLVNGRGVSYIALPAAGGPPASRYWRITFASLANAAFEIGRLVMGKAETTERNFQFGAAKGLRDFARTDFSPRGNLLRRKGKKLRTIGITYPMTFRDEMESVIEPMLERLGNDCPVALVMDPAAHAMRERRCYFGLLAGDLGSVWRNARAWEWQANMISLF